MQAPHGTVDAVQAALEVLQDLQAMLSQQAPASAVISSTGSHCKAAEVLVQSPVVPVRSQPTLTIFKAAGEGLRTQQHEAELWDATGPAQVKEESGLQAAQEKESLVVQSPNALSEPKSSWNITTTCQSEAAVSVQPSSSPHKVSVSTQSTPGTDKHSSLQDIPSTASGQLPQEAGFMVQPATASSTVPEIPRQAPLGTDVTQPAPCLPPPAHTISQQQAQAEAHTHSPVPEQPSPQASLTHASQSDQLSDHLSTSTTSQNVPLVPASATTQPPYPQPQIVGSYTHDVWSSSAAFDTTMSSFSLLPLPTTAPSVPTTQPASPTQSSPPASSPLSTPSASVDAQPALLKSPFLRARGQQQDAKVPLALMAASLSAHPHSLTEEAGASTHRTRGMAGSGKGVTTRLSNMAPRSWTLSRGTDNVASGGLGARPSHDEDFNVMSSRASLTQLTAGLTSQQGLKLWTGNKSKAEVPRLAVRLVAAKGLLPDAAVSSGGSKRDVFVRIKCEKECRTSASAKSDEACWDEFFVFEVHQPAFAVLRVKAYDRMTCCLQPKLLGEVRLHVQSISDTPGKYAQPTWHQLRNRQGLTLSASVQLQLCYMSMRVHRPLNVMCCTWNVGNAAPPGDLSAWLKDVDKMTHDIVAIGVQECAYRPTTTQASSRSITSQWELDEEEEEEEEETQGTAHHNHILLTETSSVGTPAQPHQSPFRTLTPPAEDDLSQQTPLTHPTQSSPSPAQLQALYSDLLDSAVSVLSDRLSYGHSRQQAPHSPGSRMQPHTSAAVGSHPLQWQGTTLEDDRASMQQQQQLNTAQASTQHHRPAGPDNPCGGPVAEGRENPVSVAPNRTLQQLRQLHPSSMAEHHQQPQPATATGGTATHLSLLMPQHHSPLQHVPDSPTGDNTDDENLKPMLSDPSMHPMFARRLNKQITTKKGNGDTSRLANIKDVWEEKLKEAMGPQYWMVRGVHMGQMRLVVFARNDVAVGIGSVVRGSQATGVAGVATNKGGVAIALKVWDTELCFINSHLAAHQDKCFARNANYRDIVKGIRLDNQQMDLLTAYHHVFWMGDLNYRLEYGAQAVNPTDSPDPDDFDCLVNDIKKEKWEELLGTCQLRREMQMRRAFHAFQEPEINFAPTFKVERKAGYVYKSQRSPAWCDRVLYRSNLPLKQVRPLEYFAVPSISTSDHKPVSAIFSVPTVWKQDGEGQSSVTLVITRLAAKNLSVPGQNKQNQQRTSAVSLPSSKITLKGPCLQDADGWESHVVRQNRNPLWVGPPPDMTLRSPPTSPKAGQSKGAQGKALPMQLPKLFCLRLDLQKAPLQDLANRRILVRVVDGSESRVSSGSSLARGVLALTAPALQLLQSGGPDSQKTCQVTVDLEHNGLPAGQLEVEMALHVEQSAAPAEPQPTNLLKRMSMRMSFKHVSSRKSSNSTDEPTDTSSIA